MVSSIIYSFIHGLKEFTLFSTGLLESPYNARITCYDSGNDLFQESTISSQLFAHKSLKYVDDNISTWFDDSVKKLNL